MVTPGLGWAEKIDPQEADRFSRIAKLIAEMQSAQTENFGSGRALHRKQIAALKGRLEILGDIPDYCKQGLFREPKTYECFVRLSNGSSGIVKDSAPDVRGFAIKVLGVQGMGALGRETQCQDFLLINHSRINFSNSLDFVEVAAAGAKSQIALLKHVVNKYGLVRGLKIVKDLFLAFSRPFSGFQSETFFSVVPLQFGPAAVKVRIVPQAPSGPKARGEWKVGISKALKRELIFDFQVQFFVDEKSTPIENPSVEWTSRFYTVARLVFPKQTINHFDLETQVDRLRFDPWQGLAEHRPLGEIMRARKVAYLVSQKGRGV